MLASSQGLYESRFDNTFNASSVVVEQLSKLKPGNHDSIAIKLSFMRSLRVFSEHLFQ